MSGEGDERDTRNLATRRRQAHREDVLEFLRNKGLLQKVIEDAEKLADETRAIDANMVTRIKAANDLRMKAVAKYIPDLKSVEMTGEDGGEIRFFGKIERTIVSPENPDR